jgi:hypothetical protein
MGITRNQAFPSKYMSKEDVLQGPQMFVVNDVRMETIKGDNSEEDKAVVYFRGHDKPMILNQTNWITLEEAYGADTDGWIGKPVEVYHDPGIMYGGKRTGGTRVRIPSGASVAAPAAAVTNNGAMSFPDAIALAATVGMSKDDLVAALKAHGLTGYSAARDGATVKQIVAAKTAEADSLPF